MQVLQRQEYLRSIEFRPISNKYLRLFTQSSVPPDNSEKLTARTVLHDIIKFPIMLESTMRLNDERMLTFTLHKHKAYQYLFLDINLIFHIFAILIFSSFSLLYYFHRVQFPR